MCQRDGYPEERQQINEVTAVIDGNNIYGSADKTTDNLRDKKSKLIKDNENKTFIVSFQRTFKIISKIWLQIFQFLLDP